MFTKEQDQAFAEHPPLFTFWSELTEHRTVDDIAQRYGLNDASVYLYLRQLETLRLVELGLNNACKLLVPTHTSFEKGSKFPLFFTSQVLNRLQARVIDLPKDDDQAFLITLKAELTHEEFIEITHKLDDWMFNKLRESQDLRAREGLAVAPYTFGFMAAKGAFHDKLPPIPKPYQHSMYQHVIRRTMIAHTLEKLSFKYQLKIGAYFHNAARDDHQWPIIQRQSTPFLTSELAATIR